MFLTIKYKGERDISNLNMLESIKIGFAQAIAIAPGISRSGLTYFTTLKSGIRPKDAFKFSFLLSIPTILAAAGVELITNYKTIDLGVD